MRAKLDESISDEQKVIDLLAPLIAWDHKKSAPNSKDGPTMTCAPTYFAATDHMFFNSNFVSISATVVLSNLLSTLIDGELGPSSLIAS